MYVNWVLFLTFLYICIRYFSFVFFHHTIILQQGFDVTILYSFIVQPHCKTGTIHCIEADAHLICVNHILLIFSLKRPIKNLFSIKRVKQQVSFLTVWKTFKIILDLTKKIILDCHSYKTYLSLFMVVTCLSHFVSWWIPWWLINLNASALRSDYAWLRFLFVA